jgi:hypothetical protein
MYSASVILVEGVIVDCLGAASILSLTEGVYPVGYYFGYGIDSRGTVNFGLSTGVPANAISCRAAIERLKSDTE